YELHINKTHKITKSLTETICDLAQRMSSFEEVSDMLDKYLHIKVSHSMIQEVSEEVGKELYEKEKKEAEDLYENQHKAINDIPDSQRRGRIYIEVDGSMVLIRGEGWKEIKLGMIFRDDRILNRNKERHIITEKDYVACLGSAEEFKKMLWSEAIKNGYQEVKEVVMLGDGAKWIWNIAKELFPDAVFILDYYHFEEHVHECGNAIYPEDELSRKKWVDAIIDGFLNGRVETTIKTIKPESYSDPRVREEVEDLKIYLENNRDKMNYIDYISKGYFIGSGAVESGHKHVLQQRLKLAGMRWSRGGAQYIASLRAASKSNRWSKVTDLIYDKAS
ncbi:MAG: ISKra4 family transposase, partial [Clostridiales bacterium]|nr:ISKra4 family transposase [Clostridiales bacterium]